MTNYSFKGGMHLPSPHFAENLKVKQLALPKQVALLLQQNSGEEAQPCVEIGEKVLTGQVIAKTIGKYPIYTHASISGVISAIEKRPVPHLSNINANHIVIDSDNKDQWINVEQHDKNFQDYSFKEILQKIQKAGIVGMGGAGFPTHIKIANTKKIQTLIVNAAECEPGIMCDDALMQQYPHEVIRGIEILMHACNIKKAIIAIEDDKKAAFKQLLRYNNNEHIEVVQIATKYTSGAEKILVKLLLNIEICSGKFASDFGVLCQNVGTIKAIYDAVIDNKPLISRIVTVTGSAVQIPQNYEVRLGTAFSCVIAQSHPNNKKHHVRVGGMMMGIDVENTQHAIYKTTNCIFINNAVSTPKANACIRCGKCNQVCPVDLLPQQLFWYAKSENTNRAMDYNLADCIECRCCDIVCPSHIPLTKYFSLAKTLHQKRTTEQQKINTARERFEFKEYRVKRNKKERAEMMARKKEELKQKMAHNKEEIAQALARVKNTKEVKNDSDN